MLYHLPTCLLLYFYDEWLSPDDQYGLYLGIQSECGLLEMLQTERVALHRPRPSKLVRKHWRMFETAKIAVEEIPWNAVFDAPWLRRHALEVRVNLSETIYEELGATPTRMSITCNGDTGGWFPIQFPLFNIRELYLDIRSLIAGGCRVSLNFFPALEVLGLYGGGLPTRKLAVEDVVIWPSVPPAHLRVLHGGVTFMRLPYLIPSLTHINLRFQLKRRPWEMLHVQAAAVEHLEVDDLCIYSVDMESRWSRLRYYRGCPLFYTVVLHEYVEQLEELHLSMKVVRTPGFAAYPPTVRRLVLYGDIDVSLAPWLQLGNTPPTVWISDDRLSEYDTHELLTMLVGAAHRVSPRSDDPLH